MGQGGGAGGRAAGVRACLRAVRRPPRPRRDPGHEPGRAEGRDLPRLPAGGDDAEGDPPRRRARSTTRSGASCPRTSPGGRAVAAPAELLADGGAAARSDDFFRSAEFLGAEGVTHTLVSRRALAIPLIVRDDLPGGRRDAISPVRLSGGERRRRRRDRSTPRRSTGRRRAWSASSCASGSAARPRSPAPPSARRSRSTTRRNRAGCGPRLAEQIRHNEREGWTVESSPGPEAAPARRRAFADAYTETMTRADASARYFFGRDYLDAALGFDRSWLLTALAPSGEPGAGAIVAASDGLLHYFLGATADAHLAASPFKSVVGGDARPRRPAPDTAQPRRRRQRRRRARAVQAGVRQRRAAVSHPRAGLRSRRLPRARRGRGRRRLLPRLPRAAG